MKKNTFTSVTKFTSTVLLAFLTIVLTQSCAHKISFQTSAIVPAAEGSVKMKKDNNGNYNIELTVIRLAEPSRLTPAKNTYVVWMDTQNNGTKNIGQLKTSSGMFSSALKSSLKTVSPFMPTRIFITAEDNADITYAAGQQILSTSNF